MKRRFVAFLERWGEWIVEMVEMSRDGVVIAKTEKPMTLPFFPGPCHVADGSNILLPGQAALLSIAIIAMPHEQRSRPD